jgi:hypothetical protein
MNSSNRRTTLQLIGAVAVSIVSLAGCGSSSPSYGRPPRSSTRTGLSTATSADPTCSSSPAQATGFCTGETVGPCQNISDGTCAEFLYDTTAQAYVVDENGNPICPSEEVYCGGTTIDQFGNPSPPPGVDRETIGCQSNVCAAFVATPVGATLSWANGNCFYPAGNGSAEFIPSQCTDDDIGTAVCPINTIYCPQAPADGSAAPACAWFAGGLDYVGCGDNTTTCSCNP